MPVSATPVWSAPVAERSTPRVLLVDDEPIVRLALRRFFVRIGWSVSEAADGMIARAMLEPGTGCDFELVICDLRMPRVSGEEFYQWLVRHRPDAAARLIFSSGDILSAETAAFLAQVSRPVLAKPFELRDLGRMIGEVCGSAHEQH